MENKEKIFNVKKVLGVVFNVLFYLFIIFLLIFAIANIRAKSDDGSNLPNIFGRGFMSVSSTSMEGKKENSFNKGDLIFVKIANDQDIDNLKVGDIVTFWDISIEQPNKLNTHRIVAISEDKQIFTTQGDYVDELYPTQSYISGDGDHRFERIETFNRDQIRAIYTGKWSGAGEFLNFLQTATGFALCIVLPTFLLLSFEVFTLIRNVMKLKHEKEIEKNKQTLEDEKEKMRAELLEQLKKEQEEANKKEID